MRKAKDRYKEEEAHRREEAVWRSYPEGLLTSAMVSAATEYFRGLDREIAAAYAKGMDLAISGPEWEALPTAPEIRTANSFRLVFIQLQPGQVPPMGRSWTIIRSSGIEPQGEEEGGKP